MKYFISLLLSLALVMQWGGESVLTSAAVTDNTGTSHLELLVGEPADGEPQTIFDWFRKMWLALSTVDTNTAQLAGKIDQMSADMASMKSLIKSQNATVGGGCYFTVYSKDYPFLDTFKVRVTDGTSTKSSYINFNEDSEYYSAELRVPTTSSTVDVFILDPDTNEEQVKFTATGVNTTSGYANINLDPLFAGAYATPLEKNKKLATVMYKSSIVTQNTSWLPTVCNNLANHQEHFQDFLLSCAGLNVASQNFEQLYANESEFLSVVDSNAGSWLLANSTFGNYVANSRPLLRSISFDSIAINVVESTTSFHTYLNSTALQKLTSTEAGGVENTVSGNLLVLSVTSGSRGGASSCHEYVGTLYYSGSTRSQRYYLTARRAGLRGSTLYTKSENTQTLISAGSCSGFLEYGNTGDRGWSNWGEWEYWHGSDSTSASVSVNAYKFADNVLVQEYPGANIAVPAWTIEDRYSATDPIVVNTGSQSASSSTADSVITYIDLDAVD